jgi:uncharacterized protein
MLSEPRNRIITLDIVRGIAVMGILLANIPGFALPESAYFSPIAAGGRGPMQVGAWLLNFIVVEGKMRGLFALLFGASMLLVIDRAKQANENAIVVHYCRMGALFVFGFAHLYLVWWGDILAHYALVGSIAFLFYRLSAPALVVASLLALILNLTWNIQELLAMIASAPRDTPEAIATWNNFSWFFGVPQRDWLLSERAALLGNWAEQVAWRWQYLDGVWAFLKSVGPETLAAMLMGMASYRSGFITDAWSERSYRIVAISGLGLALTAYLLLGLNTIWHAFDQQWLYFGSIVATVPFRLVGAIGYAALLVLLARRKGWFNVRLAAVGRTAFTNYLGSSFIMTAIFYGWGLSQFDKWDRASIYFMPPLIWIVMLIWSKPWLDRFAYGPFEWAWRSLARGKPQPLRRRLLSAETF